jgi:putative oxidoreductase
MDIGLLILRLGIGLMFLIAHGGPKLMGGTEMWTQVGGAMGNFGISFAPTFWGFMASAAEGIGGLCLVLGLGTRVAAALMAFTMMVAATMHLSKGDGLAGSSHAIELGVVFLALVFLGAGRYSLDAKLRKR